MERPAQRQQLGRRLGPIDARQPAAWQRLALGGSSIAFDLDGDGTVELRDFIGFRNNFGMSI